jgi:hypothetical protein
MTASSRLDLTPLSARIAFGAVYFALQLVLIATGPARPDRVFGFQMFNASSDIRIELLRRVALGDGATRLVRVRGGAWTARDGSGVLHEFRWDERVRDPMLLGLDARTHARYGADAQLFHLRSALQYVARTIPEDVETRALIAHVMVWENGRPRAPVEIEAARP